MAAPLRRQNIPTALSQDSPEVVSFLDGLVKAPVIQIGMGIKWGSTVTPTLGVFLSYNGATVNKSDYPELWGYAQNDSGYTTTTTTLTLPTVAGFIVRAR